MCCCLYTPISIQGIDATVIQTSLREMEEELGIPAEKAEVSQSRSLVPSPKSLLL